MHISYPTPYQNQPAFSGTIEKRTVSIPKLMNYEAIDTQIDDTLCRLYETCETQWHEIMDDLTPDDIEELVVRINRLPDISINFDQNDQQTYNGVTYRGLTVFKGSKVDIKISPALSKEETFLTIAHELIHALHYSQPEIRALNVVDAGDKFSLYEEYYHLLTESIPTPPAIKTFFAKRNPPVESLDNLKHGYLSEVIAHELENDLIEKHQLKQTLRQRQTTFFARAVTALNKIIKPSKGPSV